MIKKLVPETCASYLRQIWRSIRFNDRHSRIAQKGRHRRLKFITNLIPVTHNKGTCTGNLCQILALIIFRQISRSIRFISVQSSSRASLTSSLNKDFGPPPLSVPVAVLGWGQGGTAPPNLAQAPQIFNWFRSALFLLEGF